VWRGDLAPEDYTVPAPDGRPATREYAGERLARVVCADREMLDAHGISEIADALASAQIERITAAIRGIKDRHPSLTTAVVTGLGAFIGERAARAGGLAVERLSSALGGDGARCAPAASVALLLARLMTTGNWRLETGEYSTRQQRRSGVALVVKIGGSVIDRVEDFERVLESVAERARGQRVLIVPGGGPFADAVRDVDDRLRLSDESAHWMAVLAMDQYAHVIAERLPGAVLVTTLNEMSVALTAGHIPVLAPSRWLRDVDPLPHSWDVTSDSIAAWIAGAVGAARLILIKPPGATGDVVDPYFTRALPPGVASACVPADRLDALAAGVYDVRK
jgi:aspartokinase-like uncharacterized kinase